MGRPKCFDEDKVLDSAIDCFWRNGLRASSIRTLADEMGIAGPSLYNTYGCKHTLFAKALERYAETTLRTRINKVQDLPPLDGIRTFLEETAEVATTDPAGKGCLFVNTLIEIAWKDSDLSRNLKRYLDEMKAFFLIKLQAAKDRGDLPADTNIAEKAELLFIILLGVCVRARTQPVRSEIEAALAPALDLLIVKT